MTESVCCVSTCWLMSADPSVGISVRMYFCWSHGCIYIWIQVHSRAYTCLGARHASTEIMSKTVSPTGVSPEHLAGTFQALREAGGVGQSHS